MFRFFVSTFAGLLIVSLTTSAHAEGMLSAIWPFGKSESAAPSFDNIDPFKNPGKRVSSDKTLGLPSPSKILDGAEQRTASMFRKTRDSFKGVQEFGKSLNPFANRPAKTAPKKSFLDTIFPKQSVDSGSPATMDDFMKLKRPRF